MLLFAVLGIWNVITLLPDVVASGLAVSAVGDIYATTSSEVMKYTNGITY
jgi:hypothetical protein